MGEEHIQKRFSMMEPFLNERQRRLLAAAEAETFGYGGVSVVARATGLSRNTVVAGRLEIKEQSSLAIKENGRVRGPGGGRKKTVQKDPTLEKDLEALIDPATRGDPESSLRWTCKSVRKLANELNRTGHTTSHRMVAELLKHMGYSLQANRKTIEGSSHPDRGAQFEHVYEKVKAFQKEEQPVISVDHRFSR
jgi:Rhodopirellula transposase DDE domain